MEELKKIHRAIHKFDARIVVESLLVVDAGTGMNAVVQARRFQQAVQVTGVALTKLDGTGKRGDGVRAGAAAFITHPLYRRR